MIPEANKKAKLRFEFYTYCKKFLSYEGTWPEEIVGHDILITNVSLLGVKDMMTKKDYCSVNFIDVFASKKHTIIILVDGTYPNTGVIVFEEVRDLIDPDKEMSYISNEKDNYPEERSQEWM